MQHQTANNSHGKKDEESSFTKNPGSATSTWNAKDRNTDTAKLPEEAAEAVSNLKQGASQIASKAEDAISDAFEKTKGYGEKLVSEAGSAIKRNPTEALLIGGGVGLLVGFLLARR